MLSINQNYIFNVRVHFATILTKNLSNRNRLHLFSHFLRASKEVTENSCASWVDAHGWNNRSISNQQTNQAKVHIFQYMHMAWEWLFLLLLLVRVFLNILFRSVFSCSQSN